MQSGDRYGAPAAMPDRREQAADARELAADRREQEDDIREGVLDQWERELTERAASLEMLDDAEEAARQLARQRRADARRRRRADAEDRQDAAIGRGIERAGRTAAVPGDNSRSVLDEQTQRNVERLSELVKSSSTLADSLHVIVAIAADAFAEAAAITMSLTIGGRLEPAASTAAWAAQLDAVQLRVHAGPIVDAVTARTVVVAADLATDARWDLARSVGPDGRRAVLSSAILLGDAAPGALTIYAEPGQTFGRHSVLTAALLSAQASLAVGLAMERISHRAQTEAWQRGLASRDLIGQAKGILMEQHQLTADAAFELLRVTSQHRNTKVRDIAEHLVTHRLLPESESSAADDRAARPDAD